MIRRKGQAILADRYWHPEQECAPVSELAATLEQRLATTDLFVRAARSPLYRDRWFAAGVDPSHIRSYANLQRVPYTNSADLRTAQEACHPDEFVCSDEAPRLWVSTSGSTGTPKWVPIGSGDLETSRSIGHRLGYFVAEPAKPDDVALIITAPAPFISDTTHWAGLINETIGDGPRDVQPIEGIFFSFEDAVEGVSMALKRQVTILLAFPSLVMRMAEELTRHAPQVASRLWKEKPNPLTLLAYVITRLRPVRPRDITKVHTGIFAGEPLDPYRKALVDAWGLRWSYNGYTFSEYQVGLCECRAQDGLHVWLDVSLPEIILHDDLNREQGDEDYVPPARPLWEASAGDEGELVLTHFGDAFPLVRWRTSDLVRVISTQPCECGRSLPRVTFLQRSDDMVNLGIIRFSTFEVQKALDSVVSPAAVASWQLRVGRSGYKPLITLLVRPDSVVDERQMIAAVVAALDSLDVLRLGVENGLLADPIVRVVPDLEHRMSASGKFRPLVYEPAGGTST